MLKFRQRHGNLPSDITLRFEIQTGTWITPLTGPYYRHGKIPWPQKRAVFDRVEYKSVCKQSWCTQKYFEAFCSRSRLSESSARILPSSPPRRVGWGKAQTLGGGVGNRREDHTMFRRWPMTEAEQGWRILKECVSHEEDWICGNTSGARKPAVSLLESKIGVNGLEIGRWGSPIFMKNPRLFSNDWKRDINYMVRVMRRGMVYSSAWLKKNLKFEMCLQYFFISERFKNQSHVKACIDQMEIRTL